MVVRSSRPFVRSPCISRSGNASILPTRPMLSKSSRAPKMSDLASIVGARELGNGLHHLLLLIHRQAREHRE